MECSTKSDPKPIRDIAYYQQRFRNRVFLKIVEFVEEEARKQNLTQKEIAVRIRKDPAQLSRLLSSPSNLTLDTISDLLLAFDAEAEPPEIVKFAERVTSNHVHPLFAKAIAITPRQFPATTGTTAAGTKVFDLGGGTQIKVIAGSP